VLDAERGGGADPNNEKALATALPFPVKIRPWWWEWSDFQRAKPAEIQMSRRDSNSEREKILPEPVKVECEKLFPSTRSKPNSFSCSSVPGISKKRPLGYCGSALSIRSMRVVLAGAGSLIPLGAFTFRLFGNVEWLQRCKIQVQAKPDIRTNARPTQVHKYLEPIVCAIIKVIIAENSPLIIDIPARALISRKDNPLINSSCSAILPQNAWSWKREGKIFV
jgi:hypothetical protein